MPGIAALARADLRGLRCSVTPWAVLVLAVMAWIARAQEPPAFRASGVAYFGPSVEAALVVALTILPLCWIAGGSGAGAHWNYRSVHPGWVHVLARAWALFRTSGEWIGCTLLWAALLDLVYGRADIRGLAGAACSGGLVALCIAGTAPAVLYQARSLPDATLRWLLLLAPSLGMFGSGFPIPLEFLTQRDWTQVDLLDATARSVLIAGGGLGLAVALERNHSP